MFQLRKKILVGILCSALVLSTSQSVGMTKIAAATSEAEADAVESTEATEPTEGEAEEDTVQEEAPPTDITEEEALAQCEVYAENSLLTLYVNTTTGTFAVKNKLTDYCWWSNPYNGNTSILKSAILLNTVKVTDTENNTNDPNSFDAATVDVQKIANGYKAYVDFASEGIMIPYSVVLADDHFDVTVHVDEIVEKEHQGEASNTAFRSVWTMSMFKYLGSAYEDQDGYFIVPDGSGAVINFNNGTTTSDYSQQLYGRDVTKSQDMAPVKTEQAYMPVLGIVRDDNAILAVVSEGAAYATANANVSGRKGTSYNSAWFDFNLRSTDNYFMGQSNTALNAYEFNKIPEAAITVKYFPIGGTDEVDYVDVALRYQKYLVDTGVLNKEKAAADYSPFYLDVFGGTVKEQSVAGFPVSLQTPATTYSQAKYIIEQLAARGVDNMIVTYEDFNKAGITGRISDGVDYASTLGGEKEFKVLADYCASIGATLAPSVDIQEYERSGNGFSKTGGSCIRVTKAYATLNEYERAFGTPHDTRDSWYILTPAYYTKAVESIVADYTAKGIGAISLEQATNMLYSDFTANENKHTSRQQAIVNLQACYQMIKDNGLTFVADACNDYALKYVDYVRNVPLYSSNFDIYDYDIPFYQIVIHGYLPYTTKAKNASSSADELFLLSAATGTPVHYEVMYENPNEFTDSTYDTLFYTYYEGWLDIAAEEYKFNQQYIKSLSDKTITDFEYLSENVIKTTFSDGTEITADLENITLEIGGNQVALPNFN